MAPVFFKHVVGRESWEVHAHRCATRAWRAASSGHILDKLAVCQGRRAPAAHRQPRLKSCGLEAIVSWRTSCSSAAAQYIVGQAGTAETLQGRRWEPGRPPHRAAGSARLLTFDSECGRRGWSHTIQSVAMASDCSPATSGSAAARSAGGHSPRSNAVQQALIEKSCCTKTLGNRLNFVTRRCKTKQQNGRHLVFAEPAGDSAWHQQQELLSDFQL